ncbi:MAG: Hypoxanthine phosphoribosyltransferase [Turneriella sp.]|nr:Hypoxanthine phosphoribosyltransferase [Turneriella sp.]
MYTPVPALITKEEIEERILKIGKQITADYAGQSYLRVIGALRGSFVFMADLIRAIEMPVKVDFMEISSYGKAMVSSGNIKILKDLTDDPHGENVIIAEDIVDTGLTLQSMIDLLKSRGVLSLEVAALLVKPNNVAQHNKLKYPVKYKAFEISDEFVVGVGLDYKGFMRNLPYIAQVTDANQLKLFDEA